MQVRSKCDAVVDSLLARIVNREYLPGDRLPSEGDLCAQYAVSRVTLRESLKKLQMMDVISIQQGRGTFVRGVGLGHFMQPMFRLIDFGEFDIQTIYDARLYIEAGTSRLAALNRKEEDLDLMSRLLDAMDRLKDAEAAPDLDALHELDSQFHIQIAIASGNEILKAAVMNLESISAACAKRINLYQAVLRNFTADHQKIYEAIRDRNSKEARKAMEYHTLRSGDFLKKDARDQRQREGAP